MDTEILILDEVLSVGDIEFQQQCLKKIGEISSRKDSTILFVSHNMQSIQKMCDRVIALHRGEIVHVGPPVSVIDEYLKKEKKINELRIFDSVDTAPGNDFIKIKRVELVPQYLVGQEEIDVRTPLMFCFEFWKLITEKTIAISVQIFNVWGECIFEVNSQNIPNEYLVKGKMIIPGGLLNNGSYFISLLFMKEGGEILYNLESCLSFDVDDYRDHSSWKGKWEGYVRPDIKINFLVGEVL
jgi:lipopolysaccharide transport system ATP-binding protein